MRNEPVGEAIVHFAFRRNGGQIHPESQSNYFWMLKNAMQLRSDHTLCLRALRTAIRQMSERRNSFERLGATHMNLIGGELLAAGNRGSHNLGYFRGAKNRAHGEQPDAVHSVYTRFHMIRIFDD